MALGRTVGYGLLALVDAVVATVVAIVIVGFGLVGIVPDAESVVTIALGLGGATFVLTLIASTISHYRGGTPFAFTKLAKTVFHYWLTWPPWAPIGRRRKKR